jgi:prepilin-type N-terminal cleavage/methylation domain-containing protein
MRAPRQPLRRTSRTLRSHRAWLTLVLVSSLVPVLGGLLTESRIFFVRDLGLFFWSRHLWFRHTVASDMLPLWDPYVAAGQAAGADALNQLFMPVTLVIRLLPSDVISFNLWVALPLPIAAAGTWLFLRRSLATEPAALGAILFAASGPMVSTLNAPNLSWSVAAMPWVLWSADRLIEAPSRRRFAVAALVIALEALSGEPVTLTATIAVVVVLTVAQPFRAARDRSWAEVLRYELGLALLAVMAGVLLAAVQLLPTIVAGARAHRGALATPDFWSLHPLMLAETVMPHVFGNYYDAFLADMPWMSPLNSGREPFYYSLYVGPLAFMLAVTALVARPRRNVWWAAIAFVFAVAAMGGYTPLYPLARRLFPPLAFFRFPVKYIVVSAFAVAVMAADGWAAARDPGVQRRVARSAIGAGAVAAIAAVGVLLVIGFVTPALRAASVLAHRVRVEDVTAGAAYLVRIMPPLAARSAGLLLAGSALLVLTARHTPRSRVVAAILMAAACLDVVVSNADLNPTSPVVKMNPPAWYTGLASSQRVYIGGRLHGYMNSRDPDGTTAWEIPAEQSAVEGRLELNAELPMAPSGWHVREALSYDLPVLWPAEYDAAVRRFEDAGEAARAAFLRRSGVRWCILPEDRSGLPAITRVPEWHMTVFDCDPHARRVFVAPIAKTGGDAAWQREALFDPALGDSELRLDSVPPLAGVPGEPTPPAASLLTDAPNQVRVQASLDREAYVVLRDSYDASWRADVDGEPAKIARANGLYRAVRLPAGRHVIRFEYRPRMVVTGLIISGSTALVLAGMLIGGARRDARGGGRDARRAGWAGGFTLVELMIVISIIGILLALAFARFQNMQVRANEASAVSSLRSIAAAEWQFAQTCSNQKYATSLTALGQPAPATGQAFLSPDLTGADVVRHSGYDFRIAAKPLDGAPPACNGTPVAAGFAATADPVSPGRTGSRFFAINVDRVMYEDPSQTFTEKMPESGPPPHGSELK